MEVRVNGDDTSLYDLIDWQQQMQLWATLAMTDVCTVQTFALSDLT